MLRYELTNCTEQSPSRKANMSSASQEIPHIIWNPEVPYPLPATCTFPQPDQSSLCPPSSFFKIHWRFEETRCLHLMYSTRFCAWGWKHYIYSKRRWLCTGRHGLPSQKTWIFLSAAVRTSNVALFAAVRFSFMLTYFIQADAGNKSSPFCGQ